MYEKFIRTRIAKLRTEKNISARELSLELGQSNSYINAIENGNSMPSMRAFLYLCEYFKITPAEFFNEKNEHPVLMSEIITESEHLSENSLKIIIELMKNMK